MPGLTTITTISLLYNIYGIINFSIKKKEMQLIKKRSFKLNKQYNSAVNLQTIEIVNMQRSSQNSIRSSLENALKHQQNEEEKSVSCSSSVSGMFSENSPSSGLKFNTSFVPKSSKNSHNKSSKRITAIIRESSQSLLRQCTFGGDTPGPDRPPLLLNPRPRIVNISQANLFSSVPQVKKMILNPSGTNTNQTGSSPRLANYFSEKDEESKKVCVSQTIKSNAGMLITSNESLDAKSNSSSTRPPEEVGPQQSIDFSTISNDDKEIEPDQGYFESPCQKRRSRKKTGKKNLKKECQKSQPRNMLSSSIMLRDLSQFKRQLSPLVKPRFQNLRPSISLNVAKRSSLPPTSCPDINTVFVTKRKDTGNFIQNKQQRLGTERFGSESDLELLSANDRSIVYDLKQKVRRLTMKNGRLEYEVKTQTSAVQKLTSMLKIIKVEVVTQFEKEIVQIEEELKKMTENFNITKQILLETLKVKLSYEGIIKKAMQVEKIADVMQKLINKHQKKSKLNKQPKKKSYREDMQVQLPIASRKISEYVATEEKPATRIDQSLKQSKKYPANTQMTTKDFRLKETQQNNNDRQPSPKKYRSVSLKANPSHKSPRKHIKLDVKKQRSLLSSRSDQQPQEKAGLDASDQLQQVNLVVKEKMPYLQYKKQPTIQMSESSLLPVKSNKNRLIQIKLSKSDQVIENHRKMTFDSLDSVSHNQGMSQISEKQSEITESEEKYRRM